ncbi:hypothetical protein COT42_04900 [Candidatus Saganbacteria bacterium CG08_land_8_20_14_0_20_45_16]|uniref:Uncharacterized protein n=1 Tax=Candidatus Saganbacteria bacterium CG08_land_8_20_14_0_20_45_16 TaxID=2014293 RepID=A0A2H0XXY9_UNCSA|nr:MAG: hypothetical protein COT42_04900 [Candidatus Saganbacteria bacterium CG08_land_8_20_14_0_20_45_16]
MLIFGLPFFIPFQAGSFNQQQSMPEEADSRSYLCVSPENEMDWNAALLEFAHDQCQLSQLNIQQVPSELRTEFININGGGQDSTPRSQRVNESEVLADWFDSTWAFSWAGSLIRWFGGEDYCDGSLIRVRPEQWCQSLREVVTLPELQPASTPVPIPVVVQQPSVEPLPPVVSPSPPVRPRPISRPPIVQPPPIIERPPVQSVNLPRLPAKTRPRVPTF